MSATAIVARPYIGLRYFEERDAHFFYGRDEHVAELLGKIAQNRFVAVMGSSGCGKSSLVRAGLLPELRSGMIPKAGPRWKIVDFRPGSAPLQELGSAIRSTLNVENAQSLVDEGPLGIARAVAEAKLDEGTNILFIADQFEEVFRFQREEAAQGRAVEAAEQCQALARRLVDAAAQPELPIYVLLVMRSDYLGECAQFPDLPERMSESLYLVPRLRRDQLQEAITAPVGGAIEPAVVQRLLSEVGSNPDQLPRLQHLLGRMWDRAHGGRLTMEHYEQVGGWEKGLEQHLEEVYKGLSDSQQAVCARVFQQLSELDKGGAVRRRAETEELVQVCGPEAVNVTKRFREAAFLAPQESPVDITHECILREWPRLGGWLEQEARSARRLRELAEAANEAGWRPGLTGQQEKSIRGLAGLTLQSLVKWRDDTQPGTAWARRYLTSVDFEAARGYLDWSEARDERSQEEQEEQEKREMERWAATYKAQYTAAIRKTEKGGPSQDVLMQLLPILLPRSERTHLINLAQQRTAHYKGNHPLRGELRRLRSLGLIRMCRDQHVAYMKDGSSFNLADYVELTDLGKGWARTIQQIEKEEAEQALEASRRLLGAEHPDTLKKMNNLAQTLQAQGELKEARMLKERVLEVSVRVLGKEHPDTSSAAWNLHRALADDRDASAAQHVLKENLLWLAEHDPGSLAGNQQQIRQSLSEMFGNELQARVIKEVETIRRVSDALRAREDFDAALDQLRKAAAAQSVPTMVVSLEGPVRSISMAIRGAVAGARILVKGPAEYRESLIIDKPLEIIGEGKVKLVGIGGPAIASTGMVFRIATLNITAEGFSGISISGGYCVLEQLEVSGTRSSGVLIRDGAEAVLVSCSLHHAEHCGLHAQLGSKCTVVGSTVRENGTGGLFFSQGAEGSAEGNIIEENGYNGIYIAAGANPRISKNKIGRHRYAGLLVYQHDEWRHDYGPGRGMIEDNDITDGDQFGIEIKEGGDPCVRRNVIRANKEGGIWTQQRGRGTIFNNRIVDNLGPGIRNEEGHPLIGQNDIHGNKGQPIEGATQDEKYTCPTLKKVLWVDDNPANNDALIDRYRPRRIGFDLALSTKQALDFLAQGDYALIISDIGRGTDWEAGIHMIPEIRNRFPKAPPIIICTNRKAVEAHGEKAKNLGASLVTTSPEEVMHWLDNILRED